MPPALTPRDFVAKWRKVELKERSAAQEHFLDLCRLVGHAPPAEADPAGAWFTFEALAAKELGGEGFADVWKKGYFAWEYKGKHADLDKAYQQLLFYRAALQNPPLLIVSDIDSIVVRTNFTNTVQRTVTITLDDLLTPAGLQHLRNAFFHPEAFKSPQTTAEVTERAAAEFARIADLLRRYGTQPQHAAHFLIQVLFCLFAEDCALLPEGLFSRLVRQAQKQPAAFGVQLGQLFQAMADGGWFGADQIAHFDGRLFATVFIPALDSDSLDILAGITALDWSSIEPAILGTLFERSLDPAKRSQLGAHYTSREDILLIVEPVLLAPLRRRWEDVREQARALAAKRDAAAGAARGKAQKQLEALLLGFISDLSSTHVLDPACGSGNFLYVALRLLLDLEKEVGAEALALGLPRPQPAVSPAQLHGIELNEYAYELAQATVWIGYIQWLRENGYGNPGEPILKPLDTFRHMDAILTYEQGRPVEPAWPAVDVIVGNPPFLGGNKIRQGLGDRYVDDLFALYKDRVPAFADLVCYWHERARAQIAAGQARRAGLLATQAIRGGANRKVLERIKETGDIFWAESDRNWILDGATVHVSMVGFDDGSETTRTLDGRAVPTINADLTAMADMTVAQQLRENTGICFMGPSAKAPFDVDAATAERMLNAPPNVNGSPNADVVRPVASAVDLVQRSRDMWTIDFGLMSMEEAAQYEMPFEYVRKHVYPIRSQNRRAAYAAKWWQYAEARPGMRSALKGKERYLATPGVAKHRTFVWVHRDVLCNQGTLVFARADDYFFGVLHARPHELWARRQGTQLREAESGCRYTPTTTFETYPCPWPPGAEPAGDPRVAAIAAAARELVEKRDTWLNPPGAPEAELRKRTLTNLYNQRPTWLALAHEKLDAAVLDAYGWPHDLGDEEILERLLALNLERAGRE